MFAVMSSTTTVRASTKNEKAKDVRKSFRKSQRENARSTGKQIVKACRGFAQDELKRTRTLFTDHRKALKDIFGDDENSPVVEVVNTEEYFE